MPIVVKNMEDHLLGCADGRKEEQKKYERDNDAWNKFRDTGLLWFVNMILHLFGWTLILTYEDGKVTHAWSERTKDRGSAENLNATGYERVSKYLKDNIKDLYKEAKN